MLESLISSKTRIKLLLKFFLNSNAVSYLRNLETEFGESTNGIRVELNKMEEAGLLNSFIEGNKKMFRANTLHPLYKEIHSILLKHVGLDTIIENVVSKLGEVQEVYLTGEFSKGLNSPVIDLILVGNIDKAFLLNLIEKAEALIQRKIRYVTYKEIEFLEAKDQLLEDTALLLWKGENN